MTQAMNLEKNAMKMQWRNNLTLSNCLKKIREEEEERENFRKSLENK